MPGERPISSLVLAELYDAGDGSFLDLIFRYRGNFAPILPVIERWKKDQRAWARKLKFEFLSGGKSPWESRVVFKRLFKQAWADGDSELMARFMVALDCSIRRRRRKRYRYVQGVTERIEVLKLPGRPAGEGFTTATKHYLRRRAWRYFRKLGHQDGLAYVNGIRFALVRYTDDDLRAGENLLDNWGLMHACFGKSAEIEFSARHTNLSAAGNLGELQAMPMFERHWALPGSVGALMEILLGAQCRPVRIWAIQLLKRLHQDTLPRIEAATLLKLLDHPDEDVAAFAAELLDNAQEVSAFAMETWMQLLGTRNPNVVAMICRAFAKHVSFDRVTLAQAVELAVRVATPVASIGLEILSSRTIRSDLEFREVAGLSRAQSAGVAGAIAEFALSKLNTAKVYRLDEVIAFFDSRLKSMRVGAFTAMGEQTPAGVDPGFWARLFESPYDDVRFELVKRLKRRVVLPGASVRSTAFLWQTVLLNVHRGGRAKLTALRQISERIVREPDAAEMLLPVLVIAIRSVRPPEARHGLAAIVGAVDRIPSLADAVKAQLPELQLDGVGVL